jgi:glycosyltransferase involved in cell wall biosynthesis
MLQFNSRQPAIAMQPAMEQSTGHTPPRPHRKISIGLCAWNEAKRLPATISSLAKQDCFIGADSPIATIEIIVIANACTDETVAVAERCLAELVASDTQHRLSFKVIQTETKGKANAWNLFVHEHSRPDADYLLSMDCDIEFLSPNVLSRLVESLDSDPVGKIARPVCRKSTELRRDRSWSDHVALQSSRHKHAQQRYVPLPGALYCARAATLRSVWQPLGMLGDDGHVRDMIVTENWRCPNDRRDASVILVPDVEIAFDAHTGLRDIMWHQVRARIGLANRAIYHAFLYQVVGTEDASQITARLNLSDPQWYARLIQRGVDKPGWWVLPWPPFQFPRVRALARLPVIQRLKTAPIAALSDLSDLVADVRANQEFRRRRALGVW